MHQSSELFRRQLSFAHVSLQIAVATGSSDIGSRVAAAIFSWRQMLSGTLKTIRLFDRQMLLICESLRIGDPHQTATVSTAAVLVKVCAHTVALNRVGHAGSLVRETRSL
jgi:hypothetical protein